MRRLIWSAAAIAALLGGAFLYFGQDAKAEAPALSLASVTRGSLVVTVAATGTLEPVDTVEVGTQVSGTISTLGADFNQSVQRGQVVATLDPAVLESQVTQAQATVIRLSAERERAGVQLDDARVKLSRAEQLAGRQLIAAQEVETARSDARVAEVSVKAAQAQLDQAEAALDQAKVNLSHTVITSPVNGIVLSRNVEVGQTVSAGLQAPTLFVIARSLDALRLNARVDESDVGRVAEEQTVSFIVDAYPGRTFTGTVRQVRLQPTVTQNVVSYTTVIDVPNPQRLLKPGMTATLEIEVARADDVLRVPAAALRFQPAETLAETLVTGARQTHDSQGMPNGRPSGRQGIVWVYADGRLKPVDVRLGLSDSVSTVVAGGDLAEGDEVVTGVSTPAAASAAPAGGSPLTPSFPRRGTQRSSARQTR